MRIHKEGYGVILKSFGIIAFIVLGIFFLCGWGITSKIAVAIGVIVFFLILRFFRCPKGLPLLMKMLLWQQQTARL